MINTVDFMSDVLAFVQKTYGSNIFNQIAAKQHKALVNKLSEEGLKLNYPVEKTANKIIAMLRVNP
jgi:predicted ArsR family transcriptional regulator